MRIDFQQERQWLVPCAVMTLGLALVASPLVPKAIAGWPHPFMTLYSWASWGVMFALGWMVWRLVALKRQGLDKVRDRVRAEAAGYVPRLPLVALGAGLAAIDIYCFMWLKPQIAEMVPFRGDPALAALDRALFFGHDPWTLVAFLQHEWVAVVYTPIWFLSVMACLYWLLFQKPSRERAVLLVTYFALWSVFGPVGQALFPAGGPIFYERITGDGARFAELMPRIPEFARGIAGYLWHSYDNRLLVDGAGISAMPSLHVATMTWELILFTRLAPRFAPVALIAALFIYASSIALGWHYALDGIAGAAGALLCYGAARVLVRRPAKPRPAIALAQGSAGQ